LAEQEVEPDDDMDASMADHALMSFTVRARPLPAARGARLVPGGLSRPRAAHALRTQEIIREIRSQRTELLLRKKHPRLYATHTPPTDISQF
jgi:hypothetical protein